MKVSRSFGRKAMFGVATLATAFALGACEDGTGTSDTLLTASFTIDSISQEGTCEVVAVKVQPKSLLPNPPKLSNGKMFYTEVTMAKPADAGDAPICRGQKSTIPMSPGTWEFTAPLPSGPVSCQREVAPGTPVVVTFKDGEPTCT